MLAPLGCYRDCVLPSLLIGAEDYSTANTIRPPPFWFFFRNSE